MCFAGFDRQLEGVHFVMGLSNAIIFVTAGAHSISVEELTRKIWSRRTYKKGRPEGGLFEFGLDVKSIEVYPCLDAVCARRIRIGVDNTRLCNTRECGEQILVVKQVPCPD